MVVERFEYVSDYPPGMEVTKESFAKWKKGFDLEMAEKNKDKNIDGKVKKFDDKGMEKLTGKELFVRNLVKAIDPEAAGTSKAGGAGAGGAGAGAKEGEVYWFNEALYDDLGEEELDDDEGDEKEKEENDSDE